MNLAIKRTATFHNRRIILTSTPVIGYPDLWPMAHRRAFLELKAEQAKGPLAKAAGWPWVITHPRLPQIRTCPIRASGSSA